MLPEGAFPLTSGTAPVPDVTVRVISDSTELRRVEQVWDKLVMDHTENPFLLAEFVREYMDLRRSRRWEPLLLVLLANEVPVGLVPLATKRMWGIRLVDFLLPTNFGPDFVFQDCFRESGMVKVLRFLFKDLHCQFVHLSLSSESANLPILRKKSRESGIRLCAKGGRSGHYVLPVRGGWTEFESLRGSNFRRHFKKIARNLSRAGSWRFVSSDELGDPQDVMKRMLHVENESWKEDLRRRDRRETDENLAAVWRALTCISGRVPAFFWKVYFLEVNDETIAYNLVLRLKQYAFMVKMSFSERYRNIYPGIFLANEVIRDIFNRQDSRSIDFLTAMPFMTRWAPRYLARISLCMCSEAILPTMLVSIMMSTMRIKFLDLVSRMAWRLRLAKALTMLSNKLM